jgi:hypothetical protein
MAKKILMVASSPVARLRSVPSRWMSLLMTEMGIAFDAFLLNPYF